MSEKDLLYIKDIDTTFRSGDGKVTKVLDGVSINLHRGEIIGLVGESGSGKSMTMLSALQLLPANGSTPMGSVVLDDDGKNLLDYPPDSNAMRKVRGGRIGMVFQEPMTSLNPVMTVGDQIAETVIEHFGASKAEAKAKAIEMMKKVNIPDAEARYSEYPMQFSGGMRQRIMIAMVLAAEPDILIADEATTALDVTTQALLLEMIRDLSVNNGISVIIVTHNLGIVARYAQRIFVMYAGNVVEVGSGMDIFHDPMHPYTLSLLRAIPRLDDPKDRILVPIEGLPPIPSARPNYCPFYDRCNYAEEMCKHRSKPGITQVGPGHFSCCHLSVDQIRAKTEALGKQELHKRAEKKILDEVCLDVEGVSKRFEIRKGIMKKKVAEFNAIEDITFKLRRGETIGIVGESGCGKTTLARTLMRMYTPNTGTIKMFGTDISHMSEKELKPFHKRMAMVFQDPSSSMNPRMSAGDAVAEPIVVHNIYGSAKEVSDRVNELFRLVGLDPNLKERYPHEFSGGQRQRIGVARALASDPDILILDEPISALDVSIQAQVINLLEDLQSKLGLAYLFIAHDLAVVKHISDRIIVMYLGRIMEISDSDDLYDNPIHPYTRALLSAVPIADPAVEATRKFENIIGEVPSVLNRPKGCPFSNRCSEADERCREECPSLKDVAGHMVACFKR
ncbi:MAG: ABC transporter ATP-binding protein [Firmicutes bacterium]|nr:ABC transporter ATP-binding protein [Bacillota bacterium]